MCPAPAGVAVLRGFPGAEQNTRSVWHRAQPNSDPRGQLAMRHRPAQGGADSPAWGCLRQLLWKDELEGAVATQQSQPSRVSDVP